jgi:pre-mRNA-splicing factor CDC5/CEF1
MGINREDETFSSSELGESASQAAGIAGRRSFLAAPGAGAEYASQLGLSLASLPAPKMEYDIRPPSDAELGDEVMDDGSEAAGSSARVLDAGEIAERRAAAAAAAREAELLRRSAALRHDPPLPRPLVVDEDALAPPSSSTSSAQGATGMAESLIRDEMVTLLKVDAATYPVSSSACGCRVCFVLYALLCFSTVDDEKD